MKFLRKSKIYKKFTVLCIGLICSVLLFHNSILRYVSGQRTSQNGSSSFNHNDIIQNPSSCSTCNIILIVIDTLRADHLPFYGYHRDTAPYLTSIAEKSIVFERAFSASSWTAPAVASIFTSLLPSRHRVITGFAATKGLQKRGSKITLNKLPEDMITLGEFMRDAGYQTLGFSDNLNIGPEMEFSRGFQYFKKFHYKGADNLNTYAIERLDKLDRSKPYFLYMHYMDPHMPYKKKQPYFGNCYNKTTKTRREKVVCAYDSEINYVDKSIQSLSERYEWFNNSIVIITSDHGEEFWDHGGTGHGATLYTEMTHVPFLIYHPKINPERIMDNVHNMDILPTLAGFVEREGRPEWQGKNLYVQLQTGQFKQARNILSERLRNTESLTKWWKRALVREDWHYIQTETQEGVEKGELYNIKTDFHEQEDLSNLHHAIAESMAYRISTEPLPVNKDNEENVKIELDRELYNQLRSLGYLN